jgi:hypothetical protein
MPETTNRLAQLDREGTKSVFFREFRALRKEYPQNWPSDFRVILIERSDLSWLSNCMQFWLHAIQIPSIRDLSYYCV